MRGEIKERFDMGLGSSTNITIYIDRSIQGEQKEQREKKRRKKREKGETTHFKKEAGIGPRGHVMEYEAL